MPTHPTIRGRNRLVWVLLLASAVTGCPSRGREAEPDEAEGRGAGMAHAPQKHGEEDDTIVQLTDEAAARIEIRTAPAERRPLSGVLSTTGRVDFDQDRLAHVSPRVPGRVDHVKVTLGDAVHPGQTLAVIDSIELGRAKSALRRTQVQVDLKKATLDRQQGLLENQVTSEQAVLEAQAAHEHARAAYQAARQELRLLGLSEKQIDQSSADDRSAALFALPSPIAGTVVEKHVSLGEIVSPGRNLFTVADLSRVWIWIDVYERDLARVHLEDDVTVKVDAFPDQTFEGKVGYIREQVDPDTRTARARIDAENREGRLRPGMFAEVTVTDPHGAEGDAAPLATVVPSSALQRDGREQVVFVPAGENRYERRPVKIGRHAGSLVEVLEGISGGESVVVDGTFILKSEAAKHRLGGEHNH